MPSTKSILASRGVWGAGAALTAQIVSTALNLSPGMTQELTGDLSTAVVVGFQVVSVIGSLVALYGRIAATSRLEFRWPTSSKGRTTP